MQINDFFMKGDMKGAIEFMRNHEEYHDFLPPYEAIFERGEYLDYDLPEILNKLLRLYQAYYREVFYLGKPEPEAAEILLCEIRKLLELPEIEDQELEEKLQKLCENNGYHALFGKTQGLFGPYIWKDTEATLYQVELPDGIAEYTVNILRNFVFRSWMAYLTFGRFGTGGWASPDGTINCVEEAYDFHSERFLISLLKHEAQHTVDMKKYPEITTAELEYRAKLVELYYSQNPGLLQKFIGQAVEDKTEDSHAVAAIWIRSGFAKTNQTDITAVQARALELFQEHTRELDEKVK